MSLTPYHAWYISTGMHGRAVIRELERHGWQQVRVTGSHHMLKKDGVTVPVPVHGSKDLGIGLLKKMEEQTGVKLR